MSIQNVMHFWLTSASFISLYQLVDCLKNLQTYFASEFDSQHLWKHRLSSFLWGLTWGYIFTQPMSLFCYPAKQSGFHVQVDKNLHDFWRETWSRFLPESSLSQTPTVPCDHLLLSPKPHKTARFLFHRSRQPVGTLEPCWQLVVYSMCCQRGAASADQGPGGRQIPVCVCVFGAGWWVGTSEGVGGRQKQR